jgi:hypothetical protein
VAPVGGGVAPSPRLAAACARSVLGLPALRWAVEEVGCPLDGGACEAAARAGHLEALVWMAERGFPGGDRHLDSVCVAAARAGHLHVLRWAQARDEYRYDPTDAVATAAASGGHIAVLAWIADKTRTRQRFGWGTVASAAAGAGHTDTL